MQKFEKMGSKLGELTQLKNIAYGDSFQRSGEVFQILYPHGISTEQYRDALGVLRVVDKLFRIATRKGAFGESPWRDIAGYGIVAAVADEEEDEDTQPEIKLHPVEPKVTVNTASGDVSIGDRVLITYGHKHGQIGRVIDKQTRAFPIVVQFDDESCARYVESELLACSATDAL